MINSRNHSGGAGTGAVMGSKNLKAIAVEGTKGVNIADRKEMKRLNDYMMTELIGANNNHVVPSTPQAWAEYSSPNSRWTARKGLFWGAAEGGPIETGKSRRATKIPSAFVPTSRCSISDRPQKNTRSK